MSAERLLTVDNLKVDFSVPDGTVHAVKGVSFHVDKGETLAIVGESGSGKSVSALSVLQLLPYPQASHPAGAVDFRGEELIGASKQVLRRIRGNRISMIFQEPLTALNPLHTVEKQIGEILRIHKGMVKGAARKRVLELLEKVGIKEAERRLGSFPHELSGGQRQRVMIAMALANEPDLLIADEPTTAVDVTIQATILQLLKDLQKDMGLGILFITHDLGVVEHFADRVAVMRLGEIVEEGTVAEVFGRPQHEYTQRLLAAEPKGTPPEVPDSAAEMLATEGFRVWYPIKAGVFRRTVDHIKAVDEVALRVRAGETVGVVGESGSGKSSLGLGLLRLISSRGPIVYQGRDIQGLGWKALRPLRREMQIVFQDPFGSLSPRLSVGEIVEEGLRIHGLGNPDARERAVIDALAETGLDPDTRHRYPHEFSGGQRQRVSIARAIVLKPRVVVLDEPTSALDRSVQSQIIDLLHQLQRDHDLAYLFISHDLKVVRAMSHQVIVMRDGKVVEQGPAAEVLDNPQAAYTRALMDAAFDFKADETGIVAA
ncbi:MAG: ABC transporter ATP-binding protein [Rhodospirillaceae bacterium]|nr:ABC transporter ATP-binding protein [Rhodospirillaceae bacterium]